MLGCVTDILQPCLCVMYFLNYVDRNAIAQARLNNLEEDLNMTGTEFNTTVSMYVDANTEILKPC
jgi:hypothetical protein